MSNDSSLATIRCVTPSSLRHTTICPPGEAGFGENDCEPLSPKIEAIQAAGATLWYLPPYSPDLNPIELCFAKLKALVRTARCRSTETLWPFLGECLAHFSPDECRNYFRHCGYSAATRS